MKSLKYNLLVLAVLALGITPSFANSITIFGTGQGLGSGGVLDPNYQLIGGGPLGTLPPQLFTTPPFFGWIPASPGTQWINPFGNTMNAPAGVYDYQTTFNLTGLNPLTAVLTGDFAADNDAMIFLNGSFTTLKTMDRDGIPGNGFEQLTPFTISCPLGTCGTVGFLPGINHLDFMVTNRSEEHTSELQSLRH